MFDFLSQIQDAIVISIAPRSFKLEEDWVTISKITGNLVFSFLSSLL